MSAPDPATPPVRLTARRLIDGCMRLRARTMSDAELACPAIVFAPHEDDETLGCGGTILRKRALGARVEIVFMTDGAASHAPALIERTALAAEREAEARSAARVLGVEAGDLTFLGHPDGALGTRHEAAVEEVAELLRQRRPAQVFAPYRHDGLPDHVATRDIVVAALDRVDEPVDLYTYPVWFWSHWPWMRDSAMVPPFARRRRLRRSAAGALRAVSDLGVRVPIGAERDTKRRALDEHRSQMTRRADDPAWHVLADVAEGDFLARLLGDDEFFHHERRGETRRGSNAAPGDAAAPPVPGAA